MISHYLGYTIKRIKWTDFNGNENLSVSVFKDDKEIFHCGRFEDCSDSDLIYFIEMITSDTNSD